MSDKQGQFNQVYNRARAKRQNADYAEARKDYLWIQGHFKIKDIDYTDYISMLGQLGDTERELKMFTQSKTTYLRGLDLLKSADRFNRNVSNYQIQKEKYHLHSNLGLTYCAQAQSYVSAEQWCQQFQTLIDSSLKNYRQCESIVVTMIIQNQTGQEQKKWWWKQQFIAWTLNICNPLQTEAILLRDKKAFQAIIQLIQRAENFFSLCKRKTRSHLEQNLSKCLYSKALSLKFVGRKQQSQLCFQKDYEYCLKNDLKQDLRKTRHQMRKFYLQNYRFKQARSYAKGAEEMNEISAKQRQFHELSNKIFELLTKTQRNLPILEDNLFDVLLQLNGCQNMQEQALQFNFKIRNSRQFRQNKKIRYFLEYYIADTYQRLQRYDLADRSLKQAFSLASDNPEQLIWCELLRSRILMKLQNDPKRIEQIVKSCQLKSKAMGNQGLMQQCQHQLRQFYLNEKRKNRTFKFDSQQYARLIQYTQRKEARKHIGSVESQDHMKEQNGMEIQQESMHREIIQPQRRLTRPQNPYSTYLQSCKMLNIQPLDKFKNILLQDEQLNLQDYFFLPTQQIEALFRSISTIYNLDLRNFQISTKFLKGITDLNFIHSVKKLKINLIAASLTQRNNKPIYYKQFSQLLKALQNLEYLSISNCYDVEQIQAIVKSKQIHSICNLTVLKLKECQLNDKSLMFLSLGQHLPQLKRLSLSHNILEGNTLDCLSSLKDLQHLSLSSNPLTKICLNGKFEKLKQISLSNLSDKISFQDSSKFVGLLIGCEKIKMKNCDKICIRILQSFIDYITQRQEKQDSLRQINLFNSLLSSLTATTTMIMRFQINCRNLSSIDLRNCKMISNQNYQNIGQQFQKIEQQWANKNQYNGQSLQFDRNLNPQNQKHIKTANLSFINPNQNQNTSKFTVI